MEAAVYVSMAGKEVYTRSVAAVYVSMGRKNYL
jgi:hypothetical protein